MSLFDHGNIFWLKYYIKFLPYSGLVGLTKRSPKSPQTPVIPLMMKNNVCTLVFVRIQVIRGDEIRIPMAVPQASMLCAIALLLSKYRFTMTSAGRKNKPKEIPPRIP